MARRPCLIAWSVLFALTAATASYARAARIDTVSPAVARPGDRVSGLGGSSARGVS